MKKSLLAIAIAAAVPAVASAQVTIGGLMDIAVTNIDNGSKSKLVTTTGDRSSNNLNFRGVEEIGGGLKGLFHLELGFDVDNGLLNGGLNGVASGAGNGALPVLNSTRAGSTATTTTISGFGFTRRSIVGLEGGFGQIRGGRDYTPIFLAVNGNSIHGTSGWGSTLTYMNGNSSVGTGVVGHDVRFSNAFFYDSPTMNGFKVTAAYTNAVDFEEMTNNKNGVGSSLALVYSAGPLYAQISTSNQKDTTGTGTNLQNSTSPGKKEVMAYGGKYKLDAFELAIGGQTAEATTAGGVKTKNEVLFYGAAYSIGATRVSLQSGQVKVSGNTGSTGAGGGKDWKALTLLVNQSLSKRTSIYGTWGQISNDPNQNVLMRSNGAVYATSAAGKDPTAFGVGLVHSF